MLTSFADDEALFASIMAGASGYVLKQVRGGRLLRAIRAVGAGDSLARPQRHECRPRPAAQGQAPDEGREARPALTPGGAHPHPRRRRSHEPGDRRRAHLAEKTVKNYVSSILSKLEVARRAEAAAYLARHTTTPGTVEE